MEDWPKRVSEVFRGIRRWLNENFLGVRVRVRARLNGRRWVFAVRLAERRLPS